MSQVTVPTGDPMARSAGLTGGGGGGGGQGSGGALNFLAMLQQAQEASRARRTQQQQAQVQASAQSRAQGMTALSQGLASLGQNIGRGFEKAGERQFQASEAEKDRQLNRDIADQTAQVQRERIHSEDHRVNQSLVMATFEARRKEIWDQTLPMFLRTYYGPREAAIMQGEPFQPQTVLIDSKTGARTPLPDVLPGGFKGLFTRYLETTDPVERAAIGSMFESGVSVMADILGADAAAQEAFIEPMISEFVRYNVDRGHWTPEEAEGKTEQLRQSLRGGSFFGSTEDGFFPLLTPEGQVFGSVRDSQKLSFGQTIFQGLAMGMERAHGEKIGAKEVALLGDRLAEAIQRPSRIAEQHAEFYEDNPHLALAIASEVIAHEALGIGPSGERSNTQIMHGVLEKRLPAWARARSRGGEAAGSIAHLSTMSPEEAEAYLYNHVPALYGEGLQQFQVDAQVMNRLTPFIARTLWEQMASIRGTLALPDVMPGADEEERRKGPSLEQYEAWGQSNTFSLIREGYEKQTGKKLTDDQIRKMLLSKEFTDRFATLMRGLQIESVMWRQSKPALAAEASTDVARELATAALDAARTQTGTDNPVDMLRVAHRKWLDKITRGIIQVDPLNPYFRQSIRERQLFQMSQEARGRQEPILPSTPAEGPSISDEDYEGKLLGVPFRVPEGLRYTAGEGLFE